MKTILALLLLVLTSLPLSAAELNKTGEAKKLVADVMALIVAGNMSRALRALKPYSNVPEAEFEQSAQQIEEQGPALEERFGRTIGMEFLGEEERGDSLYSIKYLQKFQRHAIVWQFVFYKPNSKWVLASFASDANLGLLFK